MSDIFVAALNFKGGKVIIDASRVYWVSPFTACWFAALKDELNGTGKELVVVPPERENALHQFFGLGIKHYFRPEMKYTAPKNFSTVPVTKLTEPSYPLAGRVTRLLTEKLRGGENFHKALHFAIREVIENAFEHGQTDHCYMCAYSVPSKRIVRLCILDAGIGIPSSMRQSERYRRLTDDCDTVIKASEYGVSSKEEERGIGLYLLRDVAEKNEAELTILSGRAKVDISKSVESSTLDVGFPGTVVKFKLKTKRDFYYISVADWEAL